MSLKRFATVPVLYAAGGVLLAAGVLLAFLYAPTDTSTMGFSQKIFYYHVPIAWSALLSFGVAFIAAILYLRSNDPKYDMLGMVAVRLGLLFSLLVMATGMIWGRAAWSAWWAWEPRLTTFLIVCLLYTAYFVLRQTVEEESRRATFAALFAIIAFVDVPITFFATRFMPAGLHPVVFGKGGGLPGRDLLAMLVSVAGMTFYYVAMLRQELATEHLKEEIHQLKNRIGA